MKISIGSDHGGFLRKEEIIEYLKGQNYEVLDEGCFDATSCDYPVFAKKVARDVQSQLVDFGILICTTGIGVTITANKFKFVRAALITSKDVASLSRKHNNSNIICMGSKYTSKEDAIEYVNIFLNTEFEGGRHQRRVDQIEI